MNKTRVKFAGSLALALSVVGVLMAFGGQLNFLGNKRDTLQASPTNKTVTAPKKPKYTFYDELKKRKTEVDKNSPGASITPEEEAKALIEESYRYVVQVGAFSKKNDANTVKKRVESLGFSVRITKSGTKYLVQAGPFNGKKKSVAAERRLKKQKLPTLLKRLK